MKRFKKWVSGLRDRYPVIEKLVILVGVTFLLTLVMTSLVSDLGAPSVYVSGEIARRSVHSSIDYNLEDAAKTKREILDRQRAVKRFFVLENTGSYDLRNRIDTFFETFDEFFPEGGKLLSDEGLSSEKSAFERRFDIDLDGDEWLLLGDRTKRSRIGQLVVSLALPVVQAGIVSSKQSLGKILNEYGATLKLRDGDDQRPLHSPSSVYDIFEAERELQRRIPQGGFGEGTVFDSLISKLLRLYVEPNVFFDSQSTDKALVVATESVDPILTRVRKGEMIVRAGDSVTNLQARKLQQLYELRGSRGQWQVAVGYFILTIIILCSVYFFTINVWSTFHPCTADLALMSVTLLGNVFLVRVFSVMGNSLNLSFPDLEAAAFVLACPVAAGGILLQVTLGPASVFVFLMTLALLTGMFLEESWLFLLFVVIGNIVGAVSVKHCPRRSFFLWSGIRVAGINVLLLLCFCLLYPELSAVNMTWRLFLAVVSGLLSGVLATGLTPVAEYVGEYVTDIKLLELASLDRPLLRELAMQAPGTWNHSMIIGQMAEGAAEAIGANGLLSRVGAYYHDIGKLRKPHYYVENQGQESNKHEKLSPSMSVLIIKAHVKDGVELARNHNLPKAIIDFIPQHHGTSLIEYFYEKAKKEAGSEEAVEESLYRYSGPKPQTREAGILMLADAVEASSRTLSEPTPVKIQGLVQKMINRVFIKGQLDESDLTLRDLHLIAKSFTRVLSGIFHRRVEYSEPAEKTARNKVVEPVGNDENCVGDVGKTSNGTKRNGSRNSSEAGGREVSDGNAAGKSAGEQGEEALKRLGM